jgi:DNA-binding NarL/FixJ family response regulator
MSSCIALVDPCPIVHAGVAAALRQTDVSLAFATTTIRDLNDWLDSNVVQLILCDFLLEDGTAEVIQRIAKRHRTPLLLFSHWENPVYTDRMIKSGAVGLISKNASLDSLNSDLRLALDGEILWQRQDSRRITGALSTPRLDAKIEFPLTQREFEVLRTIAKGQTNKIVAESLGISYETVKEHVRHLLIKLNVQDRTQAALLAVRHGLL